MPKRTGRTNGDSDVTVPFSLPLFAIAAGLLSRDLDGRGAHRCRECAAHTSLPGLPWRPCDRGDRKATPRIERRASPEFRGDTPCSILAEAGGALQPAFGRRFPGLDQQPDLLDRARSYPFDDRSVHHLTARRQVGNSEHGCCRRRERRIVVMRDKVQRLRVIRVPPPDQFHREGRCGAYHCEDQHDPPSVVGGIVVRPAHLIARPAAVTSSSLSVFPSGSNVATRPNKPWGGDS